MLVHLLHGLIYDRTEVIRCREDDRRECAVRERLDVISYHLGDPARGIDNDILTALLA